MRTNKDYTFLFKDMFDNIKDAISLPFIAEHKNCIAIPNEYIFKHYAFIADFVYDLNSMSKEETKAFSILKEAGHANFIFKV